MIRADIAPRLTQGIVSEGPRDSKQEILCPPEEPSWAAIAEVDPGFDEWRAYVARTPNLPVRQLLKRSAPCFSDAEVVTLDAPFSPYALQNRHEAISAAGGVITGHALGRGQSRRDGLPN
jgi:hypothetical protein